MFAFPTQRWWKDVENVRALVTKRRLRKPPSYSFVELNKMVHQFFVGDTSHEQSDDIYAKLKDLNEQLKKAGYKPDTSLVLYDVEEEIKEKMLWDHSERLALAFALINTGPGTTIRITKNLCVCGDCHTVIKMISRLTNREIIMRDICRFHHFRDGLCSCGGYWMFWNCYNAASPLALQMQPDYNCNLKCHVLPQCTNIRICFLII
ncbi:hypothetical protein GLYMA_06G301550v4 [Glycine max]|nr:hypothetical protein GLYMA_06G301550v4 [Glycine max]KAH1128223.1 hypothetical protein GYH30_016687 [Glycine max]